MPLDLELLEYAQIHAQTRSPSLGQRGELNEDLLAYARSIPDLPVEKTGIQKQLIREKEKKAWEAAQEKERLDRARSELERSILPGVKSAAIQIGAGGFVSPVARLLGKEEYADRAIRFARAVEQASREREKGGFPDILQRGARGAVVSLGTMAPAGMVAGPYGAITAAAAQETNRAITTGKEAGLKGNELAGYAVAEGVWEALPATVMQKLGLGGIEDIYGKKIVSAGLLAGLKRLGIMMGLEQIEENITEVGHNVVGRILAGGPELSVENLGETIAETTVQTFIMTLFGGAPGVARSVKAGKVERITKEIVAHAEENKTPSRETWRKWGLAPELGRSRASRRAFTQEVTKLVQKQEGAPEAIVEPAVQEGVPEAEIAEAAPEAALAAEQAIPGPEAARVVEEEVPLAGDSVSAMELPAVEKPPGKMAMAAKEARAIATDFMSLASPAHAGDVTRIAGHVMRAKNAQSAQQTQVARAKARKVEAAFYVMSPDDRVDFINRMEEGRAQKTVALDGVADVLRFELDRARERLQDMGKLEEYFEDYFPHIWKHRADRDSVIGKLLKRPFRPSGFLKKRTIPTIREGIEAGLELVTDNPVDLVLMRIQQMNEYVAKTQAMDTLKHIGIARFVPASFDMDYTPANYRVVDDPIFRVQTTGDVTIEEAYDKLLFDQLISVAKAIGVSYERIVGLEVKGVGAWGVSKIGKKKIKTKFGAPLSVLAHEIGHQIGDIYGLYDYMIEAGGEKAEIELKALSQLRYEGAIPTLQFQRYVEEEPEKEAVILEAWLAAPEKMAEVAPNVTNIWKGFLAKNEHLTSLLMLDRSLVLQKGEAIVEQLGIRVLGNWALPDGVAAMVENHLSPGLRRNQNRAVKTGYDLARHIGNAMNQASLSLSFFHGLNVLTDAIASQHALGLQQIFRREGQIGEGLKNIALATTYIAPGVKAFKKGGELLRVMNEDLSQIDNPALKKTVEQIISAGGRAFMDVRYHNHAIKSLMNSIRDIRFGGISERVFAAVMVPHRMIFAGLEATTWPVMQYLVPRLKLGVFYHMAEDVYSRADKEGLTEFQTTEQLTQAWDSVDNRMGQLAYDNLFWNQYLKDVSMLAVRSVGWNLGSIREYGGAILDTPTFQARMARGDQFLSRKMAYAIGAVMTYAPLGAMLMYLMAGRWPEELKDYFFPKTGRTNPNGSPERISLPTYARDWVAWPTDPVRTAMHKMHPMWGTLSQVFWNEDYYGTEIRNSDDPWMIQLIDSVKHAGEAFIPFSVKNYQRMREAEEPIGMAAPLAALGISSAPGYITKTRAQKVAIAFLLKRIPPGSRKKEEAIAAKERKNLLKRMRGGETPTKEEWAALTPRQQQQLTKERVLTPFQSLFRRLTFSEALNVFVHVNEEEKEQVTWIMQSKALGAEDATDDEVRLYNELGLAP